jgi:transmembrane sensor
MSENRLWVLVARQLSGEASSSEAEELQGLLLQHPDKQWLVEILQGCFTTHPSETGQDTTDVYFEERFRQIVEEADENHYPSDEPEIHDGGSAKLTLFRKFLGYAAAVIGISVIGWLLYQISHPNITHENRSAKASEVISKPGVRTKLLLPDGTEVWLNSGSKLNYQKDFGTKFREVELEGEAYFDVVKDASHPFIVHTSGIDVKVLGTVFNVKSYPQDETIEATLIRGIIEVTRQDNSNSPKVIMRPNEKLIFSKPLFTLTLNGGSAKPAYIKPLMAKADISITSIEKNIPDSEKVETSWVYNRLVFDGDSFQELAIKMERWYNIKIVFKSDDLLKYRFKGAFENETIKEALDALQMTAEFSYKINNNEINLFKK